MDEIIKELNRLRDKVYIEEMSRNLDFAKGFLTKLIEDPALLDRIPEGAILVPYPVPAHEKKEKAKA
jgi:hypothetical protein